MENVSSVNAFWDVPRVLAQRQECTEENTNMAEIYKDKCTRRSEIVPK